MAYSSSPTAKDMDKALHTARVTRMRAQRRHVAEADTLPDGAMILWTGRPHLMQGETALPFSPAGYSHGVAWPKGPVMVLTPAPTVAVLSAGFRPRLHHSAAQD